MTASKRRCVACSRIRNSSIDARSPPRLCPPAGAYRISDLALASRLSFFLWSSMPDDELLTLAEQGRLREPAMLEKQVRRMVADPKSAELIHNFAGQWLNLRALDTVQPNPGIYPDFDDNLRDAFRREVELLFDSIVQEDRSVLDFLTADYTFVDERLARHYGIPNVYGSRFRRVNLGADLDMRRGLLGKGALLSVTSQATRTSPVTRGKRFLEVFLGVSPPSPPAVVPPLKPPQQDNAGNAKEPTMRERMKMHLVNPQCASCHSLFEPIGLALENFDGVGAWRLKDEGQPIDPTGVLANGTKIDGVASLRDVLMQNSEQFVRVVAEKLLTYCVGPRGGASGHAAGAIDRSRRGRWRLSLFNARAGRRQERAIPEQHQGRGDRGHRSAPLVEHSRGNHVHREEAHSSADLPARRWRDARLAAAGRDGAGGDAAGADGRHAEAPVRRRLHSPRHVAWILGAGQSGKRLHDAADLRAARTVPEADRDSERPSRPLCGSAGRPEPSRPLGGVGLPLCE